MNILNTVRETYADGPGIRYAIYVAGCTHACPGCHNPESWNFNQGEKLNDELIAKIIKEIKTNPLLTGITITGGDPFAKPVELIELLNELSYLNKNIWVYTGYTVEDLQANEIALECFKYIDVIVDGPYMEELRDTSGFCGSSNQRYINAKEIYKNMKA